MNQKTNNPCTGKHTGGKPCTRGNCTGGNCTGGKPCTRGNCTEGNCTEGNCTGGNCTGREHCAGNRLDDAAGRLHTITENRIEKHLRKTSCTNIISVDLFRTNSSCRKQICTKTFTKEFSCCMEVN